MVLPKIVAFIALSLAFLVRSEALSVVHENGRQIDAMNGEYCVRTIFLRNAIKILVCAKF